MVGMRAHQVHHLVKALEAQIGAAEHQQRGNRPRRGPAQQQCCRQQEHQLVDQRAARDLPDDRQFALGRKAHHITRCHRRIVDHDARSLRPGL
jgi:hypothetical protein